MTDLDLRAIQREGFSIELEREGSPSLKLSGTADMEMLPELGPLLTELHAELCLGEVREVTVDFRGLGFMNSSCFKCFITWIASIAKLEPERRYRVRFLTNPKFPWQRRSLEAIRAFAPALVRVEAS
jgi:hypothetical protein